MEEFLSLSKEEQKAVLVETSKVFGMNEAIVEKDLWICVILNYLFNSFMYKEYICFKGGTSLSKVHHCIERFSEDIDLAIDWKALGIEKEDAYSLRSNRQQEIYNKTIIEHTDRYLKDIWLPVLRNDFLSNLNYKCEFYVDELQSQTICFQYPKMYEESAILQVIRLEFGVLAEPFPSEREFIKPYISEVYPFAIKEKHIHVNVVSVIRTFFEKITILHREAMRTNGNYPTRYSRHYYDVYQLIQNGIANECLSHLEIMELDVAFKKSSIHVTGQNMM